MIVSELGRLAGRVEDTVGLCEASAHWAGDIGRDIYRTLGDLEAIVGKAGDSASFSEALSLASVAARSLGDVGDRAQAAVPSGHRWLAEHGSSVGMPGA